MSNTKTTDNSLTSNTKLAGEFQAPPYEHPHIRRQFDDLMNEVGKVIAPVWPLKDYVAVNPYAGIAERSFIEARAFLKVFSDCETLMPLDYYAREYAAGRFCSRDITAAIGELSQNGIAEVDSFDVDKIIESLQTISTARDSLHTAEVEPHAASRSLKTIAEFIDERSASDWASIIQDEVSKHCAAHYDDGQAVWKSPWKDLPLYQAWRSTAACDYNAEAIGLTGFRKLVSRLPHHSDAAIVWLLQALQLPERLWQPFLLCQAFSVIGWSAWTQHQTNWNGEENNFENDLNGLIALRLAYDVALAEANNLGINWESLSPGDSSAFQSAALLQEDHSLLRTVLLRASELAYRNELLSSLTIEDNNQDEWVDYSLDDTADLPAPVDRKLAQMVFCIDVRSERIRRQLEAASNQIETLGFAGFFGMPIEVVPLGEAVGYSHVPALLQPSFQLHEGLHESSAACEREAIHQRQYMRSWRKLWKDLQTSAVGCFSFVETTGLMYGWKLFAQTIGIGSVVANGKYDGIDQADHDHFGPTLRGLNHQGVTTTQQVDLAESMLTNLGLKKDFARLVVLCGHASQTENNPLAAGLDCGACCGHSGEPNARLAAMLLNQTYVRQALAKRGLSIPEDTHFLAGLHNTTTDELEFFDLNELPETHRADVEELTRATNAASEQTRLERLPIVAGKTIRDLMRRAGDWSEVRPEWGLAGNAAFVIGPRSLTQNANLDGRSFLLSYDHRNDPTGAVLEGIMTAPLVVAHWINMQYYASTVDQRHFGSGDKMVHNVVGRFGILSGNGGDLKTGLPWQSLHTGDEHQHLPMRLQAVIAAPLDSIESIIAKHEVVADLLHNGWLHLVAIDNGELHQYTERGNWQRIESLATATPSLN